MKDDAPDKAEKARQYSFLLLKYRLRSSDELSRRLQKKGFEPEVIRDTISFLTGRGFLDDESFAAQWIASRLKRPFGLRRIEIELKAKGVAPQLIRRQKEAAARGYDEEGVVLRLARNRWSKLKAVEPQKARRRIYGYLLRRGFSPDIVMDAIRSLR